jgi:hypothetical protein
MNKRELIFTMGDLLICLSLIYIVVKEIKQRAIINVIKENNVHLREVKFERFYFICFKNL